MLTIKPIQAYSDNYIWLFHQPGANQAYVVDPGDHAPVLAALQANSLELAGIVLTHHHYDHIGGVDELLKQFDVPVLGPKSTNIPQVTHCVFEGDKIDLAGTMFQVIEIPGHTLDHIAYIGQSDDQDPILFCGDTLFAAGCGRVFEGTHEQMYASLNKLKRLPNNTQVFCAHEYTLGNLSFASTVEPRNDEINARNTQSIELRKQDSPTVPSDLTTELATNPFLRCEQASVVHAASAQSGYTVQPGAETFSILRKWKDSF